MQQQNKILIKLKKKKKKEFKEKRAPRSEKNNTEIKKTVRAKVVSGNLPGGKEERKDKEVRGWV